MQIKFIVILSFVLMTFCAKAQTEKGSLLLGGSASFGLDLSYVGTGSPPDYRLRFNPNVGIFLADNFVVGGTANLALFGGGTYKTSNLGGGLFARYYFDLKNPKFKPFLHGEYSIAKYQNKSLPSKELTYRDVTMNASFGSGIAYFISDNISLETSLRYNYYNSFRKSSIPTGDHSLEFNLGLQIHLGRKKKKE